MSEVRIPTLLGLAILFVGIVIGVLLVIQRQGLTSRASNSAQPQNITVSNITDNSVTISWQTDDPVPGFIQAGPQPALGLTFKDDRDTDDPRDHRFHYVTINNLTPSTTFYYRLSSGALTYPNDEPLTVTTAAEVKKQNLPPLIGTVLDVNLQPVQEALVMVEIEGAQKLTTIAKGGNFILPLTIVQTDDLTKPFELNKTLATVIIQSSDKVSRLKVRLPTLTPLQPITIGQDLDLSTQQAASQAATPIKYDLNGDGVLNTADGSVVLGNRGRNPKDRRADLNEDGVVDQKDLDLINKEIERNSR